MKGENRNEKKTFITDKSFLVCFAVLIGTFLLTSGSVAKNVFAQGGSYNQGFRDGLTGNDPPYPYPNNPQYTAGYNDGVAKSTPYTNCEHFDTCGDPKYNPRAHHPTNPNTH
jgi:hypothetical protein